MNKFLQMILDERKRQIEKEGWTHEHDDNHYPGELAAAAACYAMPFTTEVSDLKFSHPLINSGNEINAWPFEEEWFKKKKHDRQKQLIIAGALILAELELLERVDGKDSNQ